MTYNSLDPSSKFYTENEVDEQGRTLAAFDESGEHKTTFDYERDGVTVKTERLPNGSKLSYGRDKDGTVTAITHSTENGEGNSTTQTRTLDVVTEVKSGNNTVRYEYDNKRRVKAVSLNGVDDYVTYTYSGEHTDAEKVTATMADGTTVTTTKNAHGNVTKSTVGNKTVTNTYDADQQLTKTVDSVSGETTLTYDDKGNVTSVTAPDHTESFVYDDKNVLTSKTVDSATYTFTHKATADQSLDSITVDGKTVRPQTDTLGRNTGKVIEVDNAKIAEEKISYVKFGDHATNLPSTVRFASNGVFKESMQYKYDSMGNIVEIYENGRSACRYEYDALGRLTREDNVAFGKTTTWAYDNNGNIIAKYEYAITTKPTSELHLLDCTTFTYCYAENSDQLLSITIDDGKTITTETFEYDAIGNPKKYRGADTTWQYGRQLTTYKDSTYTYDARGRRTKKEIAVRDEEGNLTEEVIETSYIYDSNGNLIKQSNGLEFLYDHTGVFAVKHGEETYFYRKDAQGNVVALLDNTGTVVVKYKYDAWGNCKVLNASGVEITDKTHIGILNPFRYRSYYFDTEISLYFLKTRYYDPEIGRFMTIDDIGYLDPDSINGLNLYAYCLNNPLKYIDHFGCSVTLTILAIIGISALIGAASGAIISGVTYAITTETFVARDFWASVAGGAVSGLIMGAFSGILIVTGGTAGAIVGLSAGVGALSSVAGSVVEGAINGKLQADPRKYLFEEILPSAMWGAAFGALGGVMSGAIKPASIVAKELGRTLEKQLIKILQYQVIKKIVPSLFENLLSDFTSWYTEFVVDNTFQRVFE